MAIQVSTDKELRNLIRKAGFILSVDYSTNAATVHRTSCPHVNPENPKGIQPSSKTSSNAGEFWYSDSREDTLKKVKDIERTKSLRLRFCGVCHP